MPFRKSLSKFGRVRRQGWGTGRRYSFDKSWDIGLGMSLLEECRACSFKDSSRKTKDGKSSADLIRWILEVAAKGNLKEFERLFEADNSRLVIKDNKGFTPAHKAAENGRVTILEFIHNHGGDLNAKNNDGNTPLHLSVQTEQADSIHFLLNHGADSTILNNTELAPLHLSVEINSTKALQALLKHESVNPNLPGEKGFRALHFCAYKDRSECAKILLQNGAKPCIKCDNGFFPINVAGKCAAANTLEVLIKHVEKLGYKREDVLSFSDKENNMPLHCAVNSGDLEAVRVCLNAGAPVDAGQEDKSTPLHFACAQGSLDMVKLMHETQPEKFKIAMETEDVMKMAPLHRAALFDHVAVVEFLVESGAEIDKKDVHDRTALLVASTKGSWHTVHYLVKHGADLAVKDKEERNFLHLAIKFGSRLDEFGCSFMQGINNLLNERDIYGCTPLHYASRDGYLVAIDDLLRLGATINAKNNDKKSPFHFAVRYGRYNTCKRLLESSMGPNIINETDGDGLSALHIAAQNGHTKILTLLMQKGAYVTRDNWDNSPLHLAAENGYTRSMKLLLKIYPNLLDVQNKDGDTALHIASRTGHGTAVDLLMSLDAKFLYNKEDRTFFDIAISEQHPNIAMIIVSHNRWEEAMDMCSRLYRTPMNGLIQNLPDVCMAVLDRCLTHAKLERNHKEYYKEYNFKYLQYSQEAMARYKKYMKKDSDCIMPMYALNTMVKHGRVQCLSHPVSQAFLRMKWKAYGSWFHITNIVVYVIFLALLTVMVTTCKYTYASITENVTGSINGTTNGTKDLNETTRYELQRCKFTNLHRLCVYVILVFCSLNMVKEVFQMFQQRSKYFTDLTNYLEWILYITSMLFIVPFVTDAVFSWQWEAGAIAIFLAWFNCLLFLQRFDFFGIYVVMFLEILHTLIQVLSVFSILVIAFGLSFYLLMYSEESAAFSTPSLSFLRTAMMMLELDFMASFNDPYTDGDERTLHFGGVTILLLCVFVLLMPILLMNLLIGLAVGDINSVQKNATLKRLAMQVELHTDLERKLPEKLLRMVDKDVLRYYPNRCIGQFEKIWNRMTFVGSDFDDCGMKCHNDHVTEELYKQKIRIKEMSTNLEKQYDLIRLIVQKMEIHTEEDNKDEGFSTEGLEKLSVAGKGWSAPMIKHNLLKQSAIVAQWKSSMDK